jgi:ABC-type branched-subunit amino acid transport system substrate-binding protein
MNFHLKWAGASLLVASVLLASASESFAQSVPGVTEKEIVIGSCAALEGPSRFLGRETLAGVEAYFELVNEEGGENVRKLRLVSFDESYEPAKTQACWDKLRALQEAGPDAEGMVITQVVPPYYLTDLKTVALYRHTLQKYMTSVRPNLVSLEGFVDAMVMVEGLKKAGKDLTREGLIGAIESLYEEDLGLGPQLKLNYSSKDHKGFNHVIPTVGRDGWPVPFTDWSIAAPKQDLR